MSLAVGRFTGLGAVAASLAACLAAGVAAVLAGAGAFLEAAGAAGVFLAAIRIAELWWSLWLTKILEGKPTLSASLPHKATKNPLRQLPKRVFVRQS
jgi:hypothetical protein